VQRPCALGITRPVFCKVSADRTQGPLMGNRLIPEHRVSPDALPVRLKSASDSDQNLTLAWNLLSGSVPCETNGTSADNRNAPGMARFYMAGMCASTLILPSAAEPRGNSFPRQRFCPCHRCRIGEARRRRVTLSRRARAGRIERCNGRLWPRRCRSRMPAMRFGWPRRKEGGCC